MVQTDKRKPLEWFDIQYERLPFYYFSYGFLGHTELDCKNLALRNSRGKLPYDVWLRAQDDKKKLQGFA